MEGTACCEVQCLELETQDQAFSSVTIHTKCRLRPSAFSRSHGWSVYRFFKNSRKLMEGFFQKDFGDILVNVSKF